MLEERYEIKPLTIPHWVCDKEKEDLLKTSYDEIVKLLSETYITVKKNFIRIGYLLWTIKRGDLYECAQKNKYDNYPRFRSDSFELFCKDYFGLSKSSVYAYISVYEKYGTALGTAVREEYKDFEYSQLLEISYLPEDIASSATSNMSVSEIRKLKPKKENSSQDKSSKKDNNQEKENKSAFIDLKAKKDEFKKYVKYFFDNYDYNLTLNGRKQGGQAFGGSLFDYLIEKGFFNV